MRKPANPGIFARLGRENSSRGPLRAMALRFPRHRAVRLADLRRGRLQAQHVQGNPSLLHPQAFEGQAGLPDGFQGQVKERKGTMRITIWTLVAAAVLTASSAFASGGAKGDFEVGIFGGYGWLDDHGDFQPKDNMLYGARLGYFLSRHWGFEGMAQQLPTKPNEDTTPPGLEAPEYRFDAYRFNGLFNFIGSDHFRPFLTAGIGQERFDLEDVTTSKELGWNAGAGFRWYMTPSLNLRADGR
jgi:hypothetical protein